MPNKKPKKSWKKGQSGNPNGRPKLPGDLWRARGLNQLEFERTVNQFLFQDREYLNRILNDPKTTAFELLIGQMITMAIKQGDFQRLNFLMDRILGKAKETIDHNVKSVPHWVEQLYSLTPEQRKRRFEELKKKMRKKK